MCRLLDVSANGYFAWLKRPPSARALRIKDCLQKIREIHKRSEGTYGSPRIHAEFDGLGIVVSQKRVARLMAQAGIEGVSRRRMA